MFTGIVTDVGKVREAEGDAVTLRRLRIACAYDPETIPLGASVACAGICLTVIARGTDGQGFWFDVQAAAETLSRTLAGGWAEGTRLNLERSLRVGDELGGHLVTGHVDGIAVVASRDNMSDKGGAATGVRFAFEAPRDLARFIAVKGSVTIDGVSLTVNTVADATFSVLVIPHTLAVTTLGGLQAGSRVHVEVDLLARYAARLAEARESGY